MKPAHRRGSYQRHAAAVRARAWADATTRCWKCGRTQAEHGRGWVAGHRHAGQVGGQLLPECRQCSDREGAAIAKAHRGGTTLTPTRTR